MIEFPCDFPIKIIFKNEPRAQDAMLAIVRRHYPDFSEDALALKPSKNGTFASITAVVHAQDQASLDALYQELTKAPHIMMVL